ncbi:MAG: hypothetical protein IH953_04195 [Chloroflexi bacterium]|nr:hypothetical protein [Chloroflexota bacterium]
MGNPSQHVLNGHVLVISSKSVFEVKVDGKLILFTKKLFIDTRNQAKLFSCLENWLAPK